jgi:hypothetical protein
MQIYLVAWAFEAKERRPPEPWRAAMERSLDFLLAHQNPGDGRLPNYGANDGSLPLVLSTCDYSDFRPTLQALSLATRGERIYPAGPWDEEAAWLLGPQALDAPLGRARRTSVSFCRSGYHILRGDTSDTFAAFRCGTVVDRFSQIDMLHVDVWWRGHNVLADPGSYMYNGAAEWHNHFVRTASHNTVQVDGLDQMLHFRKFKCLYWTKAKLLRFEDHASWAICAGEHYGFRRYPGECVHRRSVLFVKDSLWIVADQVIGVGSHGVRLHWLGGEFAGRHDNGGNEMVLETPSGPFSLSVWDGGGDPLAGDMVAGQAQPRRGWLSRYYGEKVPVPSFTVTRELQLPVTMVSVLGAGSPKVERLARTWSVSNEQNSVRFELCEGLIRVLEPAMEKA